MRFCRAGAGNPGGPQVLDNSCSHETRQSSSLSKKAKIYVIWLKSTPEQDKQVNTWLLSVREIAESAALL